MGLFETMQQRSTPVRAGVIGAGTFATMFLHQAARVPNLQVSAVVDLSEERGRAALDTAGLTGTRVATSVDAVLGADDVDVVVEATGSPVAGAAHALGAIEAGQHVVMRWAST